MSPVRKEKPEKGWKTDGHGNWIDSDGNELHGVFEIEDGIKVNTDEEDITVKMIVWLYGKKKHIYLNKEQVERMNEKLQEKMSKAEDFL